ncbi:hypothetical protein N7463_005231 [Penicillium fimorum]|uniref:Uncharacterized protein n=1 Tax=Penicillium fimorum TaxID=1882269 RepID=A0A9X0C520_9EURO|nr:hypothetical protein N7463_005231 [Penicillium fimorum]
MTTSNPLLYRDMINSEPEGLCWEVVQRLDCLKGVKKTFNELGRDNGNTANVIAIMDAYRSEDLVWDRDTVTYWAHGKMVKWSPVLRKWIWRNSTLLVPTWHLGRRSELEYQRYLNHIPHLYVDFLLYQASPAWKYNTNVSLQLNDYKPEPLCLFYSMR